MKRIQTEGVVWLEFDLLASIPGLRHAVFLRHGGVSQGNYASLNLSGSVGDDPRHVQANLNKVKTLMGVQTLVSPSQVHGNEIQVASESCRLTCDALTTSRKGLALMAHHADCQAAIFYDPIQHCLSTVHCGWRGSVQNIYAQTVAKMHALYGSRPENLLVCVSPSLGPEHAEFKHYREELPVSFWDYQVKPMYFDFWAITEMQLQQCGVLNHHIEFARLCTFGNPQDCYSYRRDKIRGGHGTLALLI